MAVWVWLLKVLVLQSVVSVAVVLGMTQEVPRDPSKAEHPHTPSLEHCNSLQRQV